MALLRELVFCPGFPKAHEFAFSVTVDSGEAGIQLGDA
jgi:hypothetical protein